MKLRLTPDAHARLTREAEARGITRQGLIETTLIPLIAGNGTTAQRVVEWYAAKRRADLQRIIDHRDRIAILIDEAGPTSPLHLILTNIRDGLDIQIAAELDEATTTTEHTP